MLFRALEGIFRTALCYPSTHSSAAPSTLPCRARFATASRLTPLAPPKMPARLCKDCVCGYGSPVEGSPSSSSSSLPEVARASSAPTDSSVEGGRGVVRTLPDGTRCYIAVPPTPLDQDYAAKQMQQLNAAKAILFCSNVFGIELVANRVRAGYLRGYRFSG